MLLGAVTVTAAEPFPAALTTNSAVKKTVLPSL